jgi:hypothetical protein
VRAPVTQRKRPRAPAGEKDVGRGQPRVAHARPRAAAGRTAARLPISLSPRIRRTGGSSASPLSTAGEEVRERLVVLISPRVNIRHLSVGSVAVETGFFLFLMAVYVWPSVARHRRARTADTIDRSASARTDGR